MEENDTNIPVGFEMMINRKHYNMFLQQTNKEKYKEKIKFDNKFKKNKTKILEIFNELMNEKPINNELKETFEDFVKASIKHIENKYYNDKDVENLFVEDDEIEHEE
jgi:signal transduction protein with GAF and PtsI domain